MSPSPGVLGPTSRLTAPHSVALSVDQGARASLFSGGKALHPGWGEGGSSKGTGSGPWCSGPVLRSGGSPVATQTPSQPLLPRGAQPGRESAGNPGHRCWVTVPLTPTEWGTGPLPAEGERNTRSPTPISCSLRGGLAVRVGGALREAVAGPLPAPVASLAQPLPVGVGDPVHHGGQLLPSDHHPRVSGPGTPTTCCPGPQEAQGQGPPREEGGAQARRGGLRAWKGDRKTKAAPNRTPRPSRNPARSPQTRQTG